MNYEQIIKEAIDIEDGELGLHRCLSLLGLSDDEVDDVMNFYMNKMNKEFGINYSIKYPRSYIDYKANKENS